MSVLEKFKSDIEASDELAARYRELAEGIAASDGELSPAEVQVRAAAELGYDLDIVELEMAAADGAELNDAELEHMAGGDLSYTTPSGCHNAIQEGKVEHCWGTDWGCYTFLWN